jgi:hypothetical protein
VSTQPLKEIPMNRLLAIGIAAIAGAAIWRRREIKSDAERASKAIVSATTSARSRIGSGNADDDEAGESTEDSDTDAAEQPAETDSTPTSN